MLLQECLRQSTVATTIYVPAGLHTINFLELLNDKITISGLLLAEEQPPRSRSDIVSRYEGKIDIDRDAILMSKGDDSVLLVIDGDFSIEHMTVDCRNVRTGLLLRNGNVLLRNCTIVGDAKSSTKIGFNLTGSLEKRWQKQIHI